MKQTFNTQYLVTIGDINYGGHMGNERALVIFHEARIRFLESLGFSEKNIGDDTGIIMVASEIRYHREVFLHDELLVEVAVQEMRSKKFILEYSVTRKSDEQQVMSGSTSFLPFVWSTKKVAKIPSQFRDKAHSFISEK